MGGGLIYDSSGSRILSALRAEPAHVFSVQDLIAIGWPGARPKNPTQAVRNAIWRFREHGVMVYSRRGCRGYSLSRDAAFAPRRYRKLGPAGCANRLLAALRLRPGAIWSLAELIELVWPDPDAEPAWPENVLRQAICKLRRRGYRIATHWGRGYRLVMPGHRPARRPEPAQTADITRAA